MNSIFNEYIYAGVTNKETILKVIGFIEENLREDINVLDMAQEGCCSLYHFIRLFQSITGLSPKKYLHQRRLTESVHELRTGDKKIADIAWDFQFGSHEAFTRAFRKYFGVNPSKVRNDRSTPLQKLTQTITEEYIYQSEKARTQSPELVELPSKTLVGISFFVADSNKAIDLSGEWGQFMKESQAIKNRLLPERFYQVQFWSEDHEPGGMYFYIGVEAQHIEETDPQFVVKIIPAGHYLKFIHKGLSNKVGYTYRYIYHQFLPETDYQLTKPFNFEVYGEKCLGPYDERSESEIYIPVAHQNVVT